MVAGRSFSPLRDIQTLFDTGTAAGLSDGQLLERFKSRRDATAEAAFEVLVLRHGPMVLRVCRNVLNDPNDAQDAFQATFLVLVRHCGSVRKRDSIGSWLYGVASRVAARARVEAARRRSVERRGGLRVVTAVDSPEDGDPTWADLGPAVQEEVRRLPEKYRAAATVLCYWQGLTHGSRPPASSRSPAGYGCEAGGGSGARDLLRRRLIRRGVMPVGSEAAPALDAVLAFAPLAIPNDLLSSTIKAGALVAAGRSVTDVTSASVAVLVQAILRSMIMMKLKTTAICLMFIGAGGGGAILAAPPADPARGTRAAAHGPRPSGTKSQPALHVMDSYVVEPPDLIIVEVLEALPGRPISGERLVRPDGKISLGFYGEIYVAGLTIEIKEKVIKHLQKHLSDETLGLVVLDDNTSKIIRKIDPKDSDRVSVDVANYNSKVYYVQGEVLVPGRLPVTGHETVLDAITFAGGLTPRADHAKVVLYRQEKGGALRTLPVNIDQITMGNDPTTNFQLEPGDRLVIPNRLDRLGTLRHEGTESEAAQTSLERSSAASRKRPGDRRDLVRRPGQADLPRDDEGSGRPDSNRGSLLGVERRLGEFERKLDMILETLKSKGR